MLDNCPTWSRGLKVEPIKSSYVGQLSNMEPGSKNRANQRLLWKPRSEPRGFIGDPLAYGDNLHFAFVIFFSGRVGLSNLELPLFTQGLA
jgi:hypothetical protein